MELEYIVNELTKYENIKQVLKEEWLMSDRLILRLKNTKQIYLNNQFAFVNQLLNNGDIIHVNLNFEESSDNIVPIQMKLDILYEDEGLIIVNKPPFMPVHPSMDHFEDSLSNGIKFYFETIGLKRKIRPINRLDKNTSGIVLFAKNEYIQECLIKQMNTGTFQKEYVAIIEGKLYKPKQTIDAPIARKENSIIERNVSTNGDKAITEIELIKSFQNYSLIKCNLKTGRTHQIRVHLNYIGHSILGDDLYGKKSELINRQALHAYKVTFIHPIYKNKIEIVAELPNDMKTLVENYETN